MFDIKLINSSNLLIYLPWVYVQKSFRPDMFGKARKWIQAGDLELPEGKVSGYTGQLQVPEYLAGQC